MGPQTLRPVKVRFRPAPPGTGIVANGVLARIENAVVHRHTTCIGRGGHQVRMVEHLLASCHALGITDLRIETDGSELPLGDGSALSYLRTLRRAGIIRFGTKLPPVVLRKPLLVQHGRRFIAAIPSPRLRINCLVEFAGIAPQFHTFGLAANRFEQELAPARTAFCIPRTSHPAPRTPHCALRNSLRLRFGLQRVNRFVFAARPRFRNELCRHKIIDLLGDLWLLGGPIRAEIFAFRPGHRLNLAFVRQVQNDEVSRVNFTSWEVG